MDGGIKIWSTRVDRHGAGFVCDPEKRMVGILIPLFALRGKSDLGVGDTETLKEAVDWCAENGFEILQILPINEMGGDSSPYNILSSMALEPSTISVSPSSLPDIHPRQLAQILTEEKADQLKQGDVQYDRVKSLKWKILVQAFANFQKKEGARESNRFLAYINFCTQEAEWLDAYVRYRALLSLHNENEKIEEWPDAHQSLMTFNPWLKVQPDSVRRRFKETEDFYRYVQWVAQTQWHNVAEYSVSKGVALMGDIPVGVSLYSADVFSEPEIFDTTRSSGAPPEKLFVVDPFTEKWGQNWGFPLYKWEAMERDNYAWWRRRLRSMCRIFHLLRVDHALGFFRIYSFPWRPEENANFLPLSPEEAMERTGQRLPCFMMRDDSSLENRLLNREQGLRLFQMLQEETGSYRIVAEDLGVLSSYVRPVLSSLEIPGFKIPQWEQDEHGRLRKGDSYERLSLATYATHDHEPIRKMWENWFDQSQSNEHHVREAANHHMRELLEFAGRGDLEVSRPFDDEVHEALLRGLYETNSWLAINMVTDVFGLRDQFNFPGAANERNWTHRLEHPVSEWSAVWAKKIAMHQRAREQSGRL